LSAFIFLDPLDCPSQDSRQRLEGYEKKLQEAHNLYGALSSELEKQRKEASVTQQALQERLASLALRVSPISSSDLLFPYFYFSLLIPSMNSSNLKKKAT
jgi:hypothetical protein